MKKSLLLIAFCFISILLSSQSTFQKAYGSAGSEQARQMVRTPDGGSIMVGQVVGDVYVVKTDSNGVMEWTRTYGGSNIEYASSIDVTSDGGYIITGYTSNNDTAWYQKAFLLKILGTGEQQWTKCYGVDLEIGIDVKQTPDHGYVVIGGTATNSSSGHIFVFRTDSVGTLLSSKRISGGGCCGDNDNGRSIHLTADGGYILFGTTWFWGSSSSVTYYAKFSSNDTLQWNRYFFYPTYCSGYSFVQTADNGFAILAEVPDGTCIYKVDSMGTYQWAKVYSWLGGVSNYNWQGESMIQTGDGGFAFTGESPSNNIFLVKAANDGTFQWAKMYGDTGNVSSVCTIVKDIDGGYSIAGATDSFGAGSQDFYLIKTDSLGNSNCNDSMIILTASDLTYYTPYGSVTIDTIGIQDTLVFVTDSVGVETVLCYHTENLKQQQSINNSIVVFPNPFTQQTTIQSDVILNNAELSVFNAFGQQVKQIKNINGQSVNIERGNLATGLYYFQLSQNNEIISVGKMVVEE